MFSVKGSVCLGASVRTSRNQNDNHITKYNLRHVGVWSSKHPYLPKKRNISRSIIPGTLVRGPPDSNCISASLDTCKHKTDPEKASTKRDGRFPAIFILTLVCLLRSEKLGHVIAAEQTLP